MLHQDVKNNAMFRLPSGKNVAKFDSTQSDNSPYNAAKLDFTVTTLQHSLNSKVTTML
jgi:hypothetical protein